MTGRACWAQEALENDAASRGAACHVTRAKQLRKHLPCVRAARSTHGVAMQHACCSRHSPCWPLGCPYLSCAGLLCPRRQQRLHHLQVAVGGGGVQRRHLVLQAQMRVKVPWATVLGPYLLT